MMILISCFMDLMTDVLKKNYHKEDKFYYSHNYEELLKFIKNLQNFIGLKRPEKCCNQFIKILWSWFKLLLLLEFALLLSP